MRQSATTRATEKRISDSGRIAVVGAGSYGTALAIQFSRAGRPTTLWGRDSQRIAAMATSRVNADFLDGLRFPDALSVTANLTEAITGADDIVVAIPSHGLRATLDAIIATGVPVGGLCWATKGFEMNSGLLPHQLVAECLPPGIPTAVLSGPTFAAEVASAIPSAMTVASSTPDYAHHLAEALSTETFRAYLSDDVTGVEVGGATKNIYAIGAGLCDGLGFGANTRAALITRGLAEMTRLGVALGAQRETFMGLAGMGDLVLSCTDDQSRNRRFGKALAAGKTADEARAEIGQVVEGYFAARAVRQVRAKIDVDMPIADQVYRMLYEGVEPREAVAVLMNRPIMREQD